MYLGSKPYALYVWRICKSLLPIQKISIAHLTASKLTHRNQVDMF
ncbi:hypothetical protein BT93_L0715 [Corymbia citriodora subsp. variegata]|uniref:Uncharacterized protein n=1 Tax=Corymbia citriodora subsp. variegata TaxID=360336 RepID=A0A8T0CTP0_CORYI|nr:hypothetical protein BT93_L0715 [Corymbia citriodora subsp. variegata]